MGVMKRERGEGGGSKLVFACPHNHHPNTHTAPNTLPHHTPPPGTCSTPRARASAAAASPRPSSAGAAGRGAAPRAAAPRSRGSSAGGRGGRAGRRVRGGGAGSPFGAGGTAIRNVCAACQLANQSRAVQGSSSGVSNTAAQRQRGQWRVGSPLAAPWQAPCPAPTSALPSTMPVRGLENQSLNWAWLANTWAAEQAAGGQVGGR